MSRICSTLWPDLRLPLSSWIETVLLSSFALFGNRDAEPRSDLIPTGRSVQEPHRSYSHYSELTLVCTHACSALHYCTYFRMKDDAVNIEMPVATQIFFLFLIQAYKHGLPSLLILSTPSPPSCWPTSLLFFLQLDGSFLPSVALIIGNGHLFFPTNFLLLAESKLDLLQAWGSKAGGSVHISAHTCLMVCLSQVQASFMWPSATGWEPRIHPSEQWNRESSEQGEF